MSSTASQCAAGSYNPCQENDDGEIDRAKMPKGGQLPRIVSVDGNGESDDGNDNGCAEGPPFSLAHPVPGQASGRGAVRVGERRAMKGVNHLRMVLNIIYPYEVEMLLVLNFSAIIYHHQPPPDMELDPNAFRHA